MYRNKEATLTLINAAGYYDIVNKLLIEARENIKIARSYLVEFEEVKPAKQLMRLMYELLWFYPEEKARITLRLEGNNLRVLLVDREERRGRKGMKEYR